jgi:prevent-host-death family protein
MLIIGAGEFKAKCLKLMDRVNQSHEEIVITKHGKPVARLVPTEPVETKPAFGFLKESITICEDITEPLDEEWEALKEEK